MSLFRICNASNLACCLQQVPDTVKVFYNRCLILCGMRVSLSPAIVSVLPLALSSVPDLTRHMLLPPPQAAAAFPLDYDLVPELYNALLVFTFKQMIMYGGPGTNRIKRWYRTIQRGGPLAWQEVGRRAVQPFMRTHFIFLRRYCCAYQLSRITGCDLPLQGLSSRLNALPDCSAKFAWLDGQEIHLVWFAGSAALSFADAHQPACDQRRVGGQAVLADE